MTSLTLHLPTELPEAKTETAARPGFWRRMFDAMVAAQMRRAEIEVRRYQHLIPQDDVYTAGYRVGLRDSGKLPFAG